MVETDVKPIALAHICMIAHSPS